MDGPRRSEHRKGARRLVRAILVGVLVSLAGVLGLSAVAGADASQCDGNPLKVFSQPPAGFDPATASNAQLAEYGFPPRPPGADQSSGAYLAWLTAVEAAKVYSPPNPVCGTVDHTSTTMGWLVGGITYTGRVPSGSASRYQPGRVRVIRDGRVVAHVRVRRNHRYRFTLRPGDYKIVGHTKWGNCTGRAHIRAGHTTHANAYCVFH
jgi:hypothetical protein